MKKKKNQREMKREVKREWKLSRRVVFRLATD